MILKLNVAMNGGKNKIYVLFHEPADGSTSLRDAVGTSASIRLLRANSQRLVAHRVQKWNIYIIIPKLEEILAVFDQHEYWCTSKRMHR